MIEVLTDFYILLYNLIDWPLFGKIVTTINMTIIIFAWIIGSIDLGFYILNGRRLFKIGQGLLSLFGKNRRKNRSHSTNSSDKP